MSTQEVSKKYYRTNKERMLAIGKSISESLPIVLTTRETANIIGCSQMAVSYIERKALSKIYKRMLR